MDLTKLVRDRIRTLGVTASAELFGKSIGTISNWANGNTLPSIEAAQLMLNEIAVSEPAAPAPIQAHQIPMVNWEGRKVMILLPCYRTLNPLTHLTLFGNYARYGADKIGMSIKDRTVIHEARNELMHIGMQTEAETFIMPDDDMVLPCENEALFNGNFRAGVRPEQARYNAISRIMSHGRDKEVVGALYFGRHEFGMPQCDWGFNAEQGVKSNELRAGRYQGLIPMPWVGTGFIKIERTAIEKFKAAIDAGRFPGLEPKPGRWYGYFTPISSAVGEDVSFCRRLGDVGVKVYLDASLVCLHADGGTLFGPRNTSNHTS